VDQMQNDNLFFKDLKEIKSPPPLFRINGCGLALYGSRDHDPRTGTYVTTHCLSLLFIPLFAFGAYRVAQAEQGGYYILGKTNLSAFARFWNFLVVLGLLAGGGIGGWHYYTTTPNYLAGQKLDQGDQLAGEGKLAEAAALYREVALGETAQRQEGVNRLRALLEGDAARAPLGKAAEAYTEAVNVERARPGTFTDLQRRASERIDQDLEADPRGALALLDAVEETFDDRTEVEAKRLGILEKVVAREPDDIEMISELALIHENQGQRQRCKELLLPHTDRLGVTEGARILGQILAREGEITKAHALLAPYIETRLQKLQSAQQAFEAALADLEQRIKNGNEPGFPYEGYNEALVMDRQAIYGEYVRQQIEQDPGLRQARENLFQEGRVAGAALDLGIVFLSRARQQPDPQLRKADLEKAEKMFLAVRQQVGEAADFQLSLGQVYYWLGRSDEGRKLFDTFLEKEGRSARGLLAVASLLREVGTFSEARQLAEEAYHAAREDRDKHNAAYLRALTAVDLDDRITWLERVQDERNLEAQASLAAARGHKALQESKDDEAARHLRAAVAWYDKIPENAASLNNGALAYFSLYQATGERSALDQGIARMERATELKSDSSILLGNASEALLQVAARDVIGQSIRLEALKQPATLGLLSYLYRDETGRKEQTEQVRRHPATAKAREYLERALVLAPRNPGRYSSLLDLFGVLRDEKGLADLRERLREAELDRADAEKQTRDWYKGEREQERLKEMRAALKRERAIREEQEKGERDLTYALAALSEAATLSGLAWMGDKADLKEAVRLVESGHAAAPSLATQSILVEVLCTRGVLGVAEANPAFRKVWERSRRALGPGTLTAAVLEHGGPLADAAASDPDISRALEMIKEMEATFPEVTGERGWALLTRADPAAARRVAERLRVSKRHTLDREINSVLNPLSATTVLERYWAARMAGEEAEAKKILADATALGIPLPFPEPSS
jgi:hypothetical protein